MEEYRQFVGLDVHKDTISIALAQTGHEDPEDRGRILNRPNVVKRLTERLPGLDPDAPVSFCYEAGPCGYGLFRELSAHGYDCTVVAPSLLPRLPGDHVKTDRRDAAMLARAHRAGWLTAVWVPGPEQEAIRDLTRAREDMKALQTKARQRLGAFLLRHDRRHPGKSRWTQAYFAWLERQRFEHPVQQLTFQEYVDAAVDIGNRVAGLEQEMVAALPEWSLSPLAEALTALRGVSLVTAMTVAAELGDITRFPSPDKLTSFVGLVPGEASSGSRRRRGAITKAGNGHVRRVLTEAAWSCRFPARKTAHLRRKTEGIDLDREVQKIAWKGQKRLCRKYARMIRAGKNPCIACSAVARELLGFMRAIAQHVMGPAQARVEPAS